MNHYPRHVGDFTKKTLGLSFAQFGCYNRLLDWYYMNECPLPLELEDVCSDVGAHTLEDQAIVQFILRKYFYRKEDGWHNQRADETLDEIYAKSEAAKKSAEARWAKQQARKDANQMRSHSDSNARGHANAMLPITHNPIPNTTPKVKTLSAAPKKPGAAAPKRQKAPAPEPKAPPELPPSAKAWEAYRQAYVAHYGTEPIRNALVNSQLIQLVKRLGAAAPDVAIFYFTHKEPFYAKKGHSVGALLADCEKLHMEMKTGRTVAERDPPAPSWWMTDAGIKKRAAELGLKDRPGEERRDFVERIRIASQGGK